MTTKSVSVYSNRGVEELKFSPLQRLLRKEGSYTWICVKCGKTFENEWLWSSHNGLHRSRK